MFLTYDIGVLLIPFKYLVSGDSFCLFLMLSLGLKLKFGFTIANNLKNYPEMYS